MAVTCVIHVGCSAIASSKIVPRWLSHIPTAKAVCVNQMLLFQVSSLVACVWVGVSVRACVRGGTRTWHMGVNLNRAEISLVFLWLLGRIPVVLVVKSGRFKNN